LKEDLLLILTTAGNFTAIVEPVPYPAAYKYSAAKFNKKTN